MKRFIAIFMTVCLVLGLSSVSAWAAEEAAWQEEAPMSTARKGLASSTVGDKIYVFGGTRSVPFDTVEIYDTKTDTWTTGKSMPTARNDLTSSVVGNKIYVFGGHNSSQKYLNTVEIYDTQTDTWTTGTSIPSVSDNRECLSSSAVGDKIYVFCGNINQYDTVEIYDTKTDTWATGKSMPTARTGLTSSVVGNKIYVFGGNDRSGPIETVEIYDTQTDTWSRGKSMPTPRNMLTSSVVGDKIYVLGGCNRLGYLNTVEIYDTQSNTWVTGTSMIAARGYLTSSVVDNKIYAIGGTSTSALDSIESLNVGISQTTAPALSVLLEEGETVQLSTSYNLDNNKNYTWSSNNEAVATVDSKGKVTALAVGEADIYARNGDGTFKEYIPIKVLEMADEQRVAVHLKSGEKAKLYLTDDASQVTWSSMDNTIATIAADGQVTGVKKGFAIVKAVLDGQTYQIYVRVNA